MALKLLTYSSLFSILYVTSMNPEAKGEHTTDNKLKALEDIQEDTRGKEKRNLTETMAESLVKTYELIMKAVHEPGWSVYIGCFILKDSWDDKKTIKIDLGWSNAVNLCTTRCWERRQRFALLWSGEECWCLNVIRGLTLVHDSSCSKPCKGNTTQVCGGSKKGSIYYTGYIDEPLYTHLTPTDINTAFQGCHYSYKYKHWCPIRPPSHRMSVPMCLDICERNLFQFASLSQYSRCCCDHNLNPYAKSGLRDCTSTCRYGGVDYYCGGRRSVYFAVYQTGATKIIAGSKPFVANEIWMEPHVNGEPKDTERKEERFQEDV